MIARRQRGFTLLELIVAAGILALIAVFSWRGLDTLIREREAIASSQATIDAIQRFFARVERDALLATDAQLDDSGTLRLTAGASDETTGAPSVVYHLESGTLTRTVDGVDRRPLVVLDGVTTMAMEAWAPAPGGGAWVRVKAAATQAPKPPPTPGGNNASGRPGATTSTTAAETPAVPSSSIPIAQRIAQQNAAVGPVVAAATGIRLSFVRADGMPVTRAFIVGGG